MWNPVGAGVPDVHGGTLAARFQPLEDLDVTGRVRLGAHILGGELRPPSEPPPSGLRRQSRRSIEPNLGAHAAAMPPPSTYQRVAPEEASPRSEEHTSELQSPCNLVCR